MLFLPKFDQTLLHFSKGLKVIAITCPIEDIIAYCGLLLYKMHKNIKIR